MDAFTQSRELGSTSVEELRLLLPIVTDIVDIYIACPSKDCASGRESGEAEAALLVTLESCVERIERGKPLLCSVLLCSC